MAQTAQATKEIHSGELEWTAGAILIATTGGGKLVPGWSRHPFGMDVAYIDDEPVWVIHHLPTGYAIAAVDGDETMAVRAVDMLAEQGNWDFTDPEYAKELRGAIKPLKDAGIAIFSPSRVHRFAGPNSAKNPA